MSGTEKTENVLILKKIRDMIKYNKIMLRQFPKEEKYSLALDIRNAMNLILRLAITINKKLYKKTTFSELNIEHEVLRQFIYLAYESRYIDSKKLKVSMEKTDEVGRLIGYWIKSEILDKGNTE